MSFLSAIVVTQTIGWPEVLLRLFVAAALGGAIGLERELRERQAGLRTHLVVSVGAALASMVAVLPTTFQPGPTRGESSRAASRMIAKVIVS